MQKALILVTTLILANTGAAAARDFTPSEPNSAPESATAFHPVDNQQTVDRAITSSVHAVSPSAAQRFKLSEPDSAPDVAAPVPSTGHPRAVDVQVTSSVRSVGFSAAQGFGPSDANDLTGPRYQINR